MLWMPFKHLYTNSTFKASVLYVHQPLYKRPPLPYIFLGEGDVYKQAIHTFMHFCYSSVYVSYSLYSFKIAIGLIDISVIQTFVTIPLP